MIELRSLVQEHVDRALISHRQLEIHPANMLLLLPTKRLAFDTRAALIAAEPLFGQCWIAPFRRFATWLLRINASRVGLYTSFSPAPSCCCRQILAQYYTELGEDDPVTQARTTFQTIFAFKAQLRDPLEEISGHPADRGLSRHMLEHYDAQLTDHNWVDPGDLYLKVWQLLLEHPKIHRSCHIRFQHITYSVHGVDEPPVTTILRHLSVFPRYYETNPYPTLSRVFQQI